MTNPTVSKLRVLTSSTAVATYTFSPPLHPNELEYIVVALACDGEPHVGSH